MASSYTSFSGKSSHPPVWYILYPDSVLIHLWSRDKFHIWSKFKLHGSALQSWSRLLIQTRDERTRVSEVCPCPRFVDMPVSEVMTLPESMSESVSEVYKNLVSVSESESEVKTFPGSESVPEVPKNVVSVSKSASDTDSDTNSCPKSCPCPFISDPDSAVLIKSAIAWIIFKTGDKK